MNSLVKQPIFYGFFAVAIIVAITWTYFDNRKQKAAETTPTETTSQVSNLTNFDPKNYDSGIKEQYALALKKATEVNPDFTLGVIEIEIGADLMPNSVSSRYIFRADSEPDYNWLITFSESTGNFIRALIPKDDYLGQISAMNTKLWKYNYVTALKLAEANGGLTWRESNTLTGVKLTLKHQGAKNWLLWNVEYTGLNSSFNVQLDAVTGKVVVDDTETNP